MENTLENKAKFFAQYWGQRVFVEAEYDLNNKLKTIYNVEAGDYAELKPLSSITDEDAKELANIVLDKSGLRNKTAKFGHDILNHFYNDYDWDYEKITIWPNDAIKIHQYLQSKGYDLPYMGLSVEKQIEYGWVKLIKI